MSVIRQDHDTAAVSVKGSLMGAHPDELLSVSVPVKRADHVAVGEHLAVPDLLSVAVVKVHNSVVAPVRGGCNLKALSVRAVVGAADPLGMAVDVTDDYLSALVHDHEAFPA